MARAGQVGETHCGRKRSSMRWFNLLSPTKPKPVPPRPLTPDELEIVWQSLAERERDTGAWPRPVRDSAAANEAFQLADLYAGAERIDDALALWIAAASFFGSHGFDLKAVALWKKVQRHRPDDPVADRQLAVLLERLGEGPRGRPTRS